VKLLLSPHKSAEFVFRFMTVLGKIESGRSDVISIIPALSNVNLGGFSMPDQQPTKTGFIYLLRDNRTGEIRYVGKTIQSLSERLERHCSAARRGMSQHVARWIKSAEYSVSIEEIECCALGLIDDRERHWIALYRSSGARLTNIRDGGEGDGGFTLTVEQRAKIAEANLRRFSSPSAREAVSESNRTRPRRKGPINWTVDGKERIRVANSRPKTESEKLAMSVAQKKRYENAEERAAFRARARKGPLSDDHKRRISLASAGVPKSDAARESYRKAWEVRRAAGWISPQKGVPRSDEVRERMRQAWIKRRAA